jgi:predicted transcriptional regulator
MSKKIIIESKNGARNIVQSRQATNQSNLEEDKMVWQSIVDGDETHQLVSTIRSRIEKNHQYYGIATKEEITFKHIQKMAQTYLDADPWLQINYCRDSTRQSIDECVQTATLAHYLNDSFVNIANGQEVLYDGKIVSKKEAVELNKKQVKSRSIDAVGKINNLEVKIFQKYAGVGGGVQTHQAVETQNWLDEAKKMQTEGVVYVAQLDGEEAESHIPQLRELTKENKNIFVGNAEQIIDWLS